VTSRTTCSALAMVLTLLLAPTVGADSIEDEDLIRRLEDENTQMRRQLAAQEERLSRLERESSVPAVSEGPATEAKPFDLTLTGFLKTDMLWNDKGLNSTSAPRFASTLGGDDQLTVTVQHSRVILKLDGPPVGEGRMRGWLEMDLFNIIDALQLNNNLFRLRQLYVAVDQPSWSILTGQAWDLFSPLNVSTLNTNGNYWFGGNGGFRRPQLRLTKRFDFGSGQSLRAAASVNANVGEAGIDAGSPVLEGSLIYDLPGILSGPIQLGVWGLWGEEEIDSLSTVANQWGVGGHMVLPLTSWAKLAGEFQHGQNLETFLMGSSIGVNPVTEEEVTATAGWVQLTLAPREGTSANLMFGIDDPDDDDLEGLAAPELVRSWNLVWGLNVKQTLYQHLMLGVEFQRFDTSFLDGDNRQANLVWVSGIMNF
jgi:hypothetical protein